MFNFNLNFEKNLDQCSRFKQKLIDSQHIVLTSDDGTLFMQKFAHFLSDHQVIYPKLNNTALSGQHSVLNCDLAMFQILVENGLTDKFNQHLQRKDFAYQIKSNQLVFYDPKDQVNLDIYQLSSYERHFFYLYLLQYLDEEKVISNLGIFKQENYLFLDLFDAPFDGSSTGKFLRIVENFKQINCLIKSFDMNTSLLVDSDKIFACAIENDSIILTKFDKSSMQKIFDDSYKKFGTQLKWLFYTNYD
jgi:hypothetical protein